MKKSLCLIIIITSFAMGQFEPGTISAGALFGYNSFGSSESGAEDRLSVITTGNPQYMLTVVKPTFSYFISSAISVDAVLDFMRIKEGDGDPDNMTMIGGGATSYFGNSLYAGGRFLLNTNKSEGDDYSSSSSSQFIGLSCGLLHKLAENVYVDVNASYLMGIGKTKYEYSYDGGSYDNEDDNKSNVYGLNIGIKAFFKQ